MTAAKKRGDQPGNANAATHGFYSDQFTEAELSLVAAFVTDPTLDDELWMQRVLNHRLLAASKGQGQHRPAVSTTMLIKLAAALAIGTGRVARLLRDQQAMSSGTHDSLQETIDRALDEIGIERGVKL